ncbi:MAG: type I-A CRISPR-associated protein Cas5a [Candidatus Verstraetearchaeota archaeon]|nr:type I-A CRISPR-associated protein Cas5a [Candidatus Verstraetearchaeota archaeon]
MLGIRIEGEYHWGYWVRVPGTSKQQSALPIPPPTTLNGALAFPLARDGLLKETKNQTKISGETLLNLERGKYDPRSVSSIFEGAILGAALALSGKAMMWEDINKYTTLHFQTTTKDKPEEKAAGGRRYLEKYKTGAISSGKVFYPKGKAVVFYAVNEDAISKAIQAPWDRHLEEACWSISRIGSKESIFSVSKVNFSEIQERTEGEVKTRLYFPAIAGEVGITEKFYRLTFWRGGWGRENAPVFSEYIIPGSNSPISSETISVQMRGRAYEFSPQEVMLIEQ